MNTAVKNFFGVATAILVLLGVNSITDTNLISLPTYDTKVIPSEQRAVASLKDINDAIVDIAEKTNPSVVTITTEKTQQVRQMDSFSMFFGNPNGREGQTKEYVQRGLGSGVIVSEEGYILTNNHVIDDTDEIKVRLFNGDVVDAKLVGADPQTDIAVLQIKANNLPVIELGNSDEAKVGSFVLAIGSPLSEDLAHTVSFGIVSARSRNIGIIKNAQGEAFGFEDFIQTDAAINPGNSGGALIDMNGELVGINSAIASRSGGNDGIGFAIPIKLAKRIMDDLVEDGSVSRGYLGILPNDVDQVMAEALGLDGVRGVLVAQVMENTPAERGGLQAQDIIISLNGEKLGSGNAYAFRNKIANFKPGDKVKFGVIRNGEERTVTVTLAERDKEVLASNTEVKEDLSKKLGFKVSELTSNVKRQLNISNDTKGVEVNEISESSSAFERGLQRGDIITSVKKNRIESAEEFYKEVEKSAEKGDQAILLTIKRNSVEQYVAFRL